MIQFPFKLIYNKSNFIISIGRFCSKLFKLIKVSNYIKFNNNFELNYNYPRKLLKQKFKKNNTKNINLKLYIKKIYSFLYFNSLYKMLSKSKRNKFYNLILI